MMNRCQGITILFTLLVHPVDIAQRTITEKSRNWFSFLLSLGFTPFRLVFCLLKFPITFLCWKTSSLKNTLLCTKVKNNSLKLIYIWLKYWNHHNPCDDIIARVRSHPLKIITMNWLAGNLDPASFRVALRLVLCCDQP